MKINGMFDPNKQHKSFTTFGCFSEQAGKGHKLAKGSQFEVWYVNQLFQQFGEDDDLKPIRDHGSDLYVGIDMVIAYKIGMGGAWKRKGKSYHNLHQIEALL